VRTEGASSGRARAGGGVAGDLAAAGPQGPALAEWERSGLAAVRWPARAQVMLHVAALPPAASCPLPSWRGCRAVPWRPRGARLRAGLTRHVACQVLEFVDGARGIKMPNVRVHIDGAHTPASLRYVGAGLSAQGAGTGLAAPPALVLPS
jgi:folylpolyglutamate synthase/dihydropteroate synthase